MLSPQQREAIHICVYKLQLLETRLRGSSKISEDELREISDKLRILLVEREYQKTWNLISHNRRITIPAADLDGYPQWYVQNAKFIQTSEAQQSGNIVDSTILFEEALTEQKIRELYEISKVARTKKTFSTEKFLSSHCIVSHGTFATRRQVIQYVANKLGGVHLDYARGGKNSTAFTMLDSLRGSREFKVFGTHGPVYLELLGIGQSLVNSDDAKELIATAARRTFGDERPHGVIGSKVDSHL